MAQDTTLPSPGDLIVGKYRIERLIGRGGMGAVFAAQHELLNQRVALKLLLGELADSKEASVRFLNEARAAAQIQGEHVARVLDIGQLPTGAPFMVLEYLEGADLAAVLHQRGPLPVVEVADYALQALDALAQAHAAGIVHRDLKPANLFLTRRHDGTSLVKVLDFGISKNLASAGPQGMTSTRAVLGSPEYMSPEQLRTPREVDARTDLWSFGVILYELLTGHMPFTGESLAELFVQILERVPPPVRTLRPDIPLGLEMVISRCMTRDPNGRYANVSELAAELMFFASEQTRALALARGSAPGLRAAMAAQQSGALPIVSATTASPWGGTKGGLSPETGRSRKVALAAVVILGLAVGAVGSAVAVRAWTNRGVVAADLPSGSASVSNASLSTAAASQAAVAPVAAALPVVVVPAVGKDKATKDAGADLSSPHPAASPKKDPPPAPSPPASVSSVSAPAAPVLAPAPAPASSLSWLQQLHAAPAPAPSSPSPARPATISPTPAASAKNCTPNYYFDKDGNKHFKPECF
jgi:serine/threonine-protein kinase